MKKPYLAFYAAFFLLAVYFAFGFIVSGIDLPLFGDEVYGYGSAIRHMAVHGISLQPKNIPYDYAFGHPQLHTACVALVAKFTGVSPLGLHKAQLIWNLILLSFTMAVLAFKSKATWNLIFLFCCLILTQPIILTQSYMLSSEFMLGILLMVVFLFSLRKQFLIATLFGLASVWVKETGIFSIAIVFLSQFIGVSRSNIKMDRRAIIASIFISTGFGAYVLLQNCQMGYFLSPTHTGKMSFTLGEVWFRFWGGMKFVFLEQGRFLLLLVLLVYSIVLKFRISNKVLFSLWLVMLFCLLSAILGHPLARYLLFPVVLMVWISTVSLIKLIQVKPFTKYTALTMLSALLILNTLSIDPFRSIVIRDVDKSYRNELFRAVED